MICFISKTGYQMICFISKTVNHMNYFISSVKSMLKIEFVMMRTAPWVQLWIKITIKMKNKVN